MAVILASAAAILYLFPARTELMWAWPMSPDMSPLTVGGGYLAGAAFFVLAVRAGRWREMAVGLLCAAVLTALLLGATVLHWGRFSHGNPAFWLWFAIYLVTPAYLPWLWARNRRHDPGVDRHTGPLLPRGVRRVVGAVGIVQLAVALAFFARPQLAVASWPWELTALNARTISAFVAFVAATWVAFLLGPRWSAHRLHVRATTLGLALIAVAALRSRGDFTGGPATAAFAALLAGAIAGLLALQAAMRPRPAPGSPPAVSAGERTG